MLVIKGADTANKCISLLIPNWSPSSLASPVLSLAAVEALPRDLHPVGGPAAAADAGLVASWRRLAGPAQGVETAPVLRARVAGAHYNVDN